MYLSGLAGLTVCVYCGGWSIPTTLLIFDTSSYSRQSFLFRRRVPVDHTEDTRPPLLCLVIVVVSLFLFSVNVASIWCTLVSLQGVARCARAAGSK